MDIGARIKHRRKALKMSADELGQKLGKDRSTVYRYENGEIEKYSFDVLKALADALETSQEYLLGWDRAEEIKKENDTLTDIVLRMETDAVFYEAVLSLYKMDNEKLSNLSAFLK